MKRLAQTIVLTLILIASVAGQEQRVFTYGSIAGIVTDSATGKPIADADLSIQELHYGAFTDSEGRFVFGSMPVNRYNVICQHIGFRPIAVESVQVTDGQTILDIRLSPSSEPCSRSFSDMTTVISPPNTEYSAPLVRLKDADHDIFLCAARVAGSSRDPLQQAHALKYVVNRCCAAGRVDPAIQVLEAIGDEFALTVALEGIDSLSIDDRQGYDRQTYLHVGDRIDVANSDWSPALFALRISLEDLDRLVALLPKVTLSDDHIASCVKIGSLLNRYGKAKEGISVTHQALSVYDSLGFGYSGLDLGKAALAVGDTAAGIMILVNALAPSQSDSCDPFPIITAPVYAIQWALLDIGAYDVAMSTCSHAWDSMMVSCDIAVALAKKGRCEDALRALESVPVGERRADALVSVAVLCARNGNPQVAFTALPIALNDYVSDSTKHHTLLGDPVSDASRRIVEGFARSGLFDTALVIARSIRDTASQCEGIRRIAESLHSVDRKAEASALLEEAYHKSFAVEDSFDLQQVLDGLSYTCMQFGDLPLAKEMLALSKGRCFTSLGEREDLALKLARSGDYRVALTMGDQEKNLEDRISLKVGIADSCLAAGNKQFAFDVMMTIVDSVSVRHMFDNPWGKAYFPEAIAVLAALGKNDAALRLAAETGIADLVSVAMTKIAGVAFSDGQAERAMALLSQSRRLCDSLGVIWDEYDLPNAWQGIIDTYVRAGRYAEALATAGEMHATTCNRASALADLALAFSKTGRELNSAEKAELRQIIAQYCK